MPAGDDASSPCTVEQHEGGTTSARAYLRTSDTSVDEPVVCFGVRGGGHVRVAAHSLQRAVGGTAGGRSGRPPARRFLPLTVPR